VIDRRALEFKLRIANESDSVFRYSDPHPGDLIMIRGLVTLALTLSVTSGASAGSHQGAVQRVSCTVVRFYVAKYSASAAEMWARSHGATDAQIEAARRCLTETPAETTQAARWSSPE
jgi:hypothetical protein